MRRKPPKTVTAYVAFGANIPPARRRIERAIKLISSTENIAMGEISSLYKTQPVGGPSQPWFLNGVVQIRTHFSPVALLKALQAVEKKLGRKRVVRWGPRTIDLDLLDYGGLRLRSKKLTLPHPRYHERRFVLAPFSEIAPAFVHPVFRRSNRRLLRELTLPGQRVTMLARWKNTRFSPFRRRKKTASRSSP